MLFGESANKTVVAIETPWNENWFKGKPILLRLGI